MNDAPDAAEPPASDVGEPPHEGRVGMADHRPRRRRRRRRKPMSSAAAPAADGDAAASAGDGESTGEASAEGGAPRPILRLRHRRRRRRLAHAPGLAPGPSEPVATNEANPSEAAPVAATVAAPAPTRFRAPRRRRRHAPLSAVTPAAEPAGETAAGGEPAVPSGEPGTRRPGRRRQRGGPGSERSERRPPEADAPAARGPGADRRDRRGGPRQAGAERGERRPDDRRGPSGRGRGGRAPLPPRKVERKLYSFDSVVDRGFDDVEEEGGETRRVHWTIVKRTTADQVSRKAVSTVYVLQREGDDSEFPNLGAARAAVNKTIVHPEKLTRSKAEHAAERGAGKK